MPLMTSLRNQPLPFASPTMIIVALPALIGKIHTITHHDFAIVIHSNNYSNNNYHSPLEKMTTCQQCQYLKFLPKNNTVFHPINE